MGHSVCQPRSLQFREGKVVDPLSPDRDSDLLLRLTEKSGACGRLIAQKARVEIPTQDGVAWPASPAINFLKQASLSKRH